MSPYFQLTHELCRFIQESERQNENVREIGDEKKNENKRKRKIERERERMRQRETESK